MEGHPSVRPASRAAASAARLALGATLLLAGAAGCRHASYGDPPGGMKIGVAYGPTGPLDGQANQAANAGVKAFVTAVGGVGAVRELVAVPDERADARYDRLVILCQSGYDPVIAVGDGYAGGDPADGPLARAARACPGTRFAIVGDSGVSAPNVANLVFADAQGAYLMGVAAARLTHTGQVGFLAACHTPRFTALEAGFGAGVEAAAAGTRVSVTYLSEDHTACPDGTDGRAARIAADGLYDGGADVVYEAVGTAGSSVFEAAKGHGAVAIGTGGDQYKTADPAVRDAIATSQVDRVDIAVADVLHGAAKGSFRAGAARYDVGNGGIRYATSGPRVGPLAPVLDGYQRKIADGTIVVPGSP
jgi:basic membrane protein A and related proteins